MTATIRLCDPCYQGATGLTPECEDGCNRSLDHDGLCLDSRSKGRRGTHCAWCGQEGRLHETERAQEYLDRLPTVGEVGPGVFMLHWPGIEQGPFGSMAEAWDYWHAEVERVA